MNANAAKEILDKITYKPKFELVTWDYENGSIEVNLGHWVPDIKKLPGKAQTFISICHKLTKKQLRKMGETDLLNWARTRILILEEHEMNEWMCYEGSHVKEPHP